MSDWSARAEILKGFDQLPDEALVSRQIVAAILGMNERTVRRKKIFEEVQVTERVVGIRVRDVRRLVRGDQRAS